MYKKDYKETPKNDIMFDMDIANAASDYDFTGAIPVPPQNEDEKENYMSILNYSPENIDIFQQKKDDKE